MFIDIVDNILFIYFLIEVLYLLILGASRHSISIGYNTHKHYRFAVLIPEGFSFPNQDYDSNYYSVFYYTNFRNSLKDINSDDYDEVVLLGPFKDVSSTLLTIVNDALNDGFKVLQLHSVLDGRSLKDCRMIKMEELRNGFYKSGRCSIGISSALDKENIVLPLKFTQEHLKSDKTNLEWVMLSHKIFIKYLNKCNVKVERYPEHFKPRPFRNAFSRLGKSLSNHNSDELERFLLHLFPSYNYFILLVFILSVATFFIDPYWSIKWWILLYFALFICCLALPDCAMNLRKSK